MPERLGRQSEHTHIGPARCDESLYSKHNRIMLRGFKHGNIKHILKGHSEYYVETGLEKQAWRQETTERHLN